MRAGILGFILGGILVVAALFLAQREVARRAVPDLQYEFSDYVFGGDKFPFGYLPQGRALHFAFFPVRITTRFFDAQHNEVAQPGALGRYGAVVRIEVNGAVAYRYITLYHAPAQVFWDDGPMKLTADLPPGTGINPAVAQTQAAQIADVFKGNASDYSQRLAVLLAGMSETSPTDPPATEREAYVARDEAWWFAQRTKLGLVPYYQYRADLPQGYDIDATKRWPLIFYLHGVGERSEDPASITSNGIAKAIAAGRQVPVVVISPLLPPSEAWSLPALSQLLDDVTQKYRIDPDRIYLIGASAGGDNTWRLALTYPDRFAAIAVMAGEMDNDDFSRLRKLPIWIFDGAQDDNVDPRTVQFMAGEIKAAGGHAHLTVYPDSGHNCWDRALGSDALYTWLFAQKRTQPEIIPPGVSFQQ